MIKNSERDFNGSLYSKPTEQESSVQDYLILMKPRIVALVVFTGICGIFLNPHHIHPLIAFSAIIAMIAGSGAASALNMWYDRDIDAKIKRTSMRPIIIGAIKASEALSFGVVLATLSVILMAILVNITSALLLLCAILSYVVVYTIWLKRHSVHNVLVGGISGALPPMIGYSAVNSEINLQSFSLFLIIFIWQVPHSWALAIFRREDYAKCNIPMLPVVRGNKSTIFQIIIYSLILSAVSYLPYASNLCGNLYFLAAFLLNAYFLWYAFALYFASAEKVNIAAKKLFLVSINYLFTLYLAMLVDNIFIYFLRTA